MTQGSSIAAAVEQKHRECTKELEKQSIALINSDVCDEVLNTLLQEKFQATKLKKDDPKACVNVYDIRLTDTFSSCGMNWPKDLEWGGDEIQEPNQPPRKNLGGFKPEDGEVEESCRGNKKYFFAGTGAGLAAAGSSTMQLNTFGKRDSLDSILETDEEGSVSSNDAAGGSGTYYKDNVESDEPVQELVIGKPDSKSITNNDSIV
ncbi:hypothetical protein D0Z03_003008 [Geotrichum reessii]|nr:hypothetical protein D0Z03_003008 [Galactomyces reessii]